MEFIFGYILDSDDDDDTEHHILSSSSSSDDNDMDEEFVLLKASRGPQVLRPRIKMYVERVVRQYSREEFKSHFRMYPETFDFVLGLIAPSLSATPTPAGRKPTEPKKQLLLSLWAMGTPDSLRSICEKFDVGKATCVRSLRRVCYALHTLAPRFIKWPKGEQAQLVMQRYEGHSAFPKIIGAIDGTHIKIRAPSDDSQSYVNRKGYHSIQVQAVCTHELLFTSVFAGNAGCVHDARVFRISPVSHYMELPNTFQTIAILLAIQPTAFIHAL